MEVYIGAIQAFAFPYAPRGWMACNGQTLNLRQYTALFSLLGTRYGGDGTNVFNLPNLNGRTPIGQGTSYTGTTYQAGDIGGVERVTLTPQQMPAHTHGLVASDAAATAAVAASGMMLAKAGGSDQQTGNTVDVHVYGPPGAAIGLGSGAISVAGGSQPFSVMQPFLVLNYCIAVEGNYPSRN